MRHFFSSSFFTLPILHFGIWLTVEGVRALGRVAGAHSRGQRIQGLLDYVGFLLASMLFGAVTLPAWWDLALSERLGLIPRGTGRRLGKEAEACLLNAAAGK